MESEPQARRNPGKRPFDNLSPVGASEPRHHTQGSAHLREEWNMAKAYKSEAFAALHESMSDLHQVGAIDSRTMREFDCACLTPVMKLSPAAIRRIRAKAAVSQAVFAAHLNVTTGVVSKWERDEYSREDQQPNCSPSPPNTASPPLLRKQRATPVSFSIPDYSATYARSSPAAVRRSLAPMIPQSNSGKLRESSPPTLQESASQGPAS